MLFFLSYLIWCSIVSFEVTSFEVINLFNVVSVVVSLHSKFSHSRFSHLTFSHSRFSHSKFSHSKLPKSCWENIMSIELFPEEYFQWCLFKWINLKLAITLDPTTNHLSVHSTTNFAMKKICWNFLYIILLTKTFFWTKLVVKLDEYFKVTFSLVFQKFF